CPHHLVDDKLLCKHQVLPLYRRGNRLYLATMDPTNTAALDELKFHTGLSIDMVAVDERQLAPLINRLVQHSEDASLDDLLDDAELEIADLESTPEAAATEADEAPVVRFANKLLLDAVAAGASDIQIEPYERSYRI